MNFVKTFLAGLLAVIVGTFLVFFLWIFILLGIAGSMEKSVAVHPESILKIDFSEVLTDAPSSDPLAGIDLMTLQTTRQLSLFKALRAIEAAGADDRIKGIYLRMNGGGGVTGSALLEELREALLEFKQSGKFIVAYNETYSQGQYYLASVADKIYLQPEGGMEWSGLASDVMFYKGLLDKLDLRAEVFRPTACKYKSAVEPFILDKMSAANREQMQALVNSMWGTISGAVCESRGIDSVKMRRITDNLQVTLPEEALEYGFVDSLLYEDQMEDVFAELGVSDDYDFITLGDYASQVGADLKNISADQVAIVYADGQIVDGEGYGKEIYGNTLAAKIAGGRVWSGADALGIGLIDTYGGLKTAIALAVDKADLGDNYRVTEVTETPTGFAAFIASLNMSVREAFTRSELGLMMKDYNTVREAFRQQGVLMYSPYKVEMR